MSLNKQAVKIKVFFFSEGGKWVLAASLQFGFYLQFNLLKPTGHVMHQQFNILQLYVLPTLYLCVL